MNKEKKTDIYACIFTAVFLYAGIGFYYYYNAPILAIGSFFLFLFLVWIANETEMSKKYWEGWNESKKAHTKFFEEEFRDKNNYLIIRAKDEERQRIVNKLEGRLTDDAVLDEYYHGYIQAMLDDLK